VQALKYLQRTQRNNREVVEAKLQDHFIKIRSIVDQAEAKMQVQL
jgi:hypothetical protein